MRLFAPGMVPGEDATAEVRYRAQFSGSAHRDAVRKPGRLNRIPVTLKYLAVVEPRPTERLLDRQG
jgi:hypothetical protein